MQSADKQKKFDNILKKFNEHPIANKIMSDFKDNLVDKHYGAILDIATSNDPKEKDQLINDLSDKLTNQLASKVVNAVVQDTKEHHATAKSEMQQVVKDTLATREARMQGDKSKQFLTGDQIKAKAEPHSQAIEQNMDLLRSDKEAIRNAVKMSLTGIIKECDKSMQKDESVQELKQSKKETDELLKEGDKVIKDSNALLAKMGLGQVGDRTEGMDPKKEQASKDLVKDSVDKAEKGGFLDKLGEIVNTIVKGLEKAINKIMGKEEKAPEQDIAASQDKAHGGRGGR